MRLCAVPRQVATSIFDYVQSVLYTFIQKGVEEEDVSLIFGEIDFTAGLQALAAVLIIEAAAIATVTLLLPAPQVQVTELRKVSARQSQVQPQECAKWSLIPPDKNGILVANWGPGDLYTTRPVLPEQIMQDVPSLRCAALSAADATVALWSGDTAVSGSGQVLCQSNRSPLSVVLATGSLQRNCQLALTSAQKILKKLQQSGGVQEHLDLFGLTCYANVTAHVVSLKFLFKTYLQPNRLITNLEVAMLCDGPQAVPSSGQPDAATLDSPGGLCTLSSPSGQCLETYVQRNLTTWHLSPEVFRVRLGSLDCLAGYGVYPPPDVQEVCDRGLTPYFDQFPHLQSGGEVLDCNLTTVRQLADYIVLDPTLAPFFNELTYMRMACPGRSKTIAEEVVDNWDNTSYAELTDLANRFDNAQVFLYSCINTRMQTPMAVFAFHWPKISILNWLAMFLLLQPAYLFFKRFRMQQTFRRMSTFVRQGRSSVVEPEPNDPVRICVVPQPPGPFQAAGLSPPRP